MGKEIKRGSQKTLMTKNAAAKFNHFFFRYSGLLKFENKILIFEMAEQQNVEGLKEAEKQQESMTFGQCLSYYNVLIEFISIINMLIFQK